MAFPANEYYTDGMKADEWVSLARRRVAALDVEGLQRAGFLPLDGGYFPSILYPPKTRYPEMGEQEFLQGYHDLPENPLVAYVHIPFCDYRCHFCHFVVQLGSSENEKDLYLKAVEDEIDLYRRRLGMDFVPARAVNVGGGTATCLSPRQLDRFLRSLRARLQPGTCAQITFDVDPTTLLGAEGMERLQILKAHGVDRITIGAQSFDDRVLKAMNRGHSARDIESAFAQARRAGFDSVSMDLIFGYTGQTPETWAKDVSACIALDADSFQIYRLRIVPHGLMPGAISRESPVGRPAFEDELVMQATAMLIAQRHGYSDDCTARVFSKNRSGISRYTQAHSVELADIIGFGASAFSSLRGKFGMNTTTGLARYLSLVSQGRIPIERGKVLTADDESRRRLILPLKNGFLDRESYQRAVGASPEALFGDKIACLKDFGLLAVGGDGLRLTQRGGFFADEVCLQFYHPQYLPFPSSAYASGPLAPHGGAAAAKRP